MSASPALLSRLDQWKNQLIDTTRRNRLLFFKSSKTGSIRLAEPDPSELFDWLVSRERPLIFVLRTPQEEPIPALNLADEAEASTTTRALPPPLQLRQGEVLTDRDDQQLNRALYSLRLRGRTSVAEQGVNILFVAFGFLNWIDPVKDEARCSPLILVPVELRREAAGAPYRLFPTDDEVIVNPTLGFLLERDCHLTLPSLPSDLDDARLDAFLKEVEAVIERNRDWEVLREVHLGTFSFQKLVIYKDLEANSGPLTQHPLIGALGGETDRLHTNVPGLSGSDLDKVLPEETFQVLDADSSQREAIEAVKAGASLVLQGPPGTGKSQTIANIISEMLAAGKKVLFVSEKMAALQVVQSRLQERGLHDFCLEVHSAKASKLELLRELGRVLRLAQRPVPAETSASLAQLRELRTRLNSYASSLHQPFGAMGWSAYEVHGRLAKLHDQPELNFAFTRPANVTAATLAGLDTLLMRLDGVRPEIVGCETHPWRGCLITEYSFQVQAEIHDRFTTLREQLRTLERESTLLAGTCAMPVPGKLHDVDHLLQVAEAAIITPRPPRMWFGDRDLTRLLGDAQVYQDRFHQFLERRARLLSRYTETVLALPLRALSGQLLSADGDIPELFLHTPHRGRRVLWDQSRGLKPLLKETMAATAKLPAAFGALWEFSGVDVPPNVRGTQRLTALTEIAATDPRPTSEWFDRTRLRAIRERARAAGEQYPALKEKQDRLLANYDDAILDLDLDAIIGRFSADYGNLTRLVRISYWKDMREVRRLMRMPGKLSVETALADLRLAREVREHRTWIAANETGLDAELGVWFRGADTDWAVTLDALDRLGQILDWFGQSTPPTRLREILCKSGTEIDTLRRLHREAVEACSATEGAFAQFFRFVDQGKLPFGAMHLADVEFSALIAWLMPVHQAAMAFWSARDELLGTARNPSAVSWSEAQADLGEGQWLQSEAAALESAAETMRSRYGHFFGDLETDWGQIIDALSWTKEFIALFLEGNVPEGVIDLVSAGGPDLAPVGKALVDPRAARLLVQEGIEHITSLFSTMIFADSGGIEQWSFDTLCEWLDLRVKRSAELERWIDFREIQAECAGAGLESFVVALLNGCPEDGTLHDLFYRRFYRLWLDQAYAAVSALRSFRGREHDRMIEQFRSLDRLQWAKYGPARVRHACIERRPVIAWSNPPQSEPGILNRELEKRRRHKPLRQLFAEIPNLLQELKPCLLMSPMTVSQLLNPDRFAFDLVIFDEASQICAEDAVGAIYRGTQLVVAGDRHQLPPTRFFTSGLSDNYDSEEEEEEEVYESILDQCRTLLPTFPLKWHYRSRHESLIAFSNHHIYRQEPHEALKTFPSAIARQAGLGVEFVHVPNGVYDRNKTRRNTEEAKRVAELVIQHLRRTPDRSLGVVALSEAQQMAILAEVEKLRVHYPELDDLFDEKRHEPFFVKNLENVQGDERDTIILNIGYARDASGQLSLNFGPMNRQGGERRLNVAVTRAKFHLKLVSSLTARDIDLTRTQSRGIHLLRAYLDYAERGTAALPSPELENGHPKDVAFEDVVRSALEARGHRITSRVGHGGYRMDLAIQDPADSHHYVLGVECDGPEYGKLATARDRDRLAASVLGGTGRDPGLGWRLHRVWSTDWVKDPDAQLALVEAALQAADRPEDNPGGDDAEEVLEAEIVLEAELVPDDSEPGAEPSVSETEEDVPPAGNGVALYRRATLPDQGESWRFYEASGSAILRVLQDVVSQEGPVHLMEATRRVAGAWGLRNAGKQIQTIVAAQAQMGVQRKLFRERDGFLWPRDMVTPPVRTHEGSQHTRKIDEICLEEISEAALLVLRQSFSLPESEAISLTARTLGFGRTGADVRARVTDALEDLVRGNQLVWSGGLVCRVNGSRQGKS